MNRYVICLTGGNYIKGIADNIELLELKESFIKYKCTGEANICEFEDRDGNTIIDFKEVQAISVKNIKINVVDKGIE